MNRLIYRHRGSVLYEVLVMYQRPGEAPTVYENTTRPTRAQAEDLVWRRRTVRDWLPPDAHPIIEGPFRVTV